jgi:hypothetical protein
VHGSHCPRCGDHLRQTNISQVTRIPIKAGFPWYSSATFGPQSTRRRQTHPRYQLGIDVVRRYVHGFGLGRLGDVNRAPGYWFTFDAGPGNDVAQEGRRLVRQWAPSDVNAPAWLEGVQSPDA